MSQYVIGLHDHRKSITYGYEGTSIEDAMHEAARIWPYPDANNIEEWKYDGKGRRKFDRWQPDVTLTAREEVA